MWSYGDIQRNVIIKQFLNYNNDNILDDIVRCAKQGLKRGGFANRQHYYGHYAPSQTVCCSFLPNMKIHYTVRSFKWMYSHVHINGFALFTNYSMDGVSTYDQDKVIYWQFHSSCIYISFINHVLKANFQTLWKDWRCTYDRKPGFLDWFSHFLTNTKHPQLVCTLCRINIVIIW